VPLALALVCSDSPVEQRVVEPVEEHVPSWHLLQRASAQPEDRFSLRSRAEHRRLAVVRLPKSVHRRPVEPQRLQT
jgi:hypothetical protein